MIDEAAEFGLVGDDAAANAVSGQGEADGLVARDSSLHVPHWAMPHPYLVPGNPNALESAFFYTQYATVHAVVTGDLLTSYRFGQLGLRLLAEQPGHGVRRQMRPNSQRKLRVGVIGHRGASLRYEPDPCARARTETEQVSFHVCSRGSESDHRERFASLNGVAQLLLIA
jgi:hypothetical protein